MPFDGTLDVPGKGFLKTQNLVLRELNESDLTDRTRRAQLDALFSDNDHLQYTSHFGAASPALTARRVRSSISKQSGTPREYYGLAIENKEGKIVGFTGLTLTKSPSGATDAKISYIVNPAEEGKGYASEAAAALVQFAFSNTAASRVIAEIQTQNAASVRTAAKAGLSKTSEVAPKKNKKGETVEYSIFEVKRPDNPPKPQLETVDDMLWAFSNGLVPDPNNHAQLQAFEVYLKMRFGNPANAGDIKSVVETIAKQLKKHPELSKEPFRNYSMSMAERSYPVTEALGALMKSPVEAAGQVRGNLFQIEANLGYWRRALDWSDPQAAVAQGKESSKEEKRKNAAAEKQRFLSHLDSVIPQEIRQTLADPKSQMGIQDKAQTLFQRLADQRAKMLAAEQDVTAISRAMVDLVHTIGFHDKEIQTALKSEDGLKRIAALRRAMDERDRFAMALGFEGHFEQVLKDLKVATPTGVDSNSAFLKKIGDAEQDVLSKAVVKTSAGSQKEIRQLSLMEAPFRSYIGGSDCSTRTYLTRALDPNYQYFTLTDSDGHSSGQITVVLGALPGSQGSLLTLGRGTSDKKIAFIDKIQNVPHEDLPIMVEALRQSLGAKGYTLALPEDLGDHNGISNAPETRELVKRWIKTTGNTLAGFKPTPHTYTLDSQYSRADQGLSIKAVAPLELPDHVKLSPLQEAYAWGTKELDLNALVAGSRKLKVGSTEDKIRYIEAQKTVKTAGLEKDPEFESKLEEWLADVNSPFQLRKRVLLYRWLEDDAPLPSLVAHLKTTEKIDFLQNCLDTPRLRDGILKKKNQLPGLLVQVRSNKKLANTLGDAFSRGHAATIEGVLAAKDISDDRALSALKQIKNSFASQNMSEATEILRVVEGTSVENDIKSNLLEAYKTNVSNPARLTREVVRHLSHENPVTRDFARDILNSQSSLNSENPMMVAVSEIEHLSQERRVTHREAAEEWLADPSRPASLKGEYLRAHLTSSDLGKLQEKLPNRQRTEVAHVLEARSNAPLFRKLASERGISSEKFSHATPESFEFGDFKFPKDGQQATLGSPADETGRSGDEAQRVVTFKEPFQMQAAPWTQLEWFSVMGNNPSRFKGDSPIRINGTEIDPNRPVENVSWDDAQLLIKKMNELDPNFNYRLPTEAEWEYAARAGRQTRYSFGDSEEDLAQHAWYSANAGSTTHPVAELKPNAFGLYDMHGNVWEWVQDGYTEKPPSVRDAYGVVRIP